MWKCNISGLLSQHRWIPLYALSGLGLVVNFYLAPVNESLISKAPAIDQTEYSQQYLLSDVRALCTMQTISDELMESFMAQLVQGSALRLPIKKLESIWSYIPTNTASRFDVPMSRTYTRLCSLFASFVREGLTEATDVMTNGEGRNKLCNSFYTHTLSAETLYCPKFCTSPTVLKLHCTFTANFTANFYDRHKKRRVKTRLFEFCFGLERLHSHTYNANTCLFKKFIEKFIARMVVLESK